MYSSAYAFLKESPKSDQGDTVKPKLIQRSYLCNKFLTPSNVINKILIQTKKTSKSFYNRNCHKTLFHMAASKYINVISASKRSKTQKLFNGIYKQRNYKVYSTDGK